MEINNYVRSLPGSIGLIGTTTMHVGVISKVCSLCFVDIISSLPYIVEHAC